MEDDQHLRIEVHGPREVHQGQVSVVQLTVNLEKHQIHLVLLPSTSTSFPLPNLAHQEVDWTFFWHNLCQL